MRYWMKITWVLTSPCNSDVSLFCNDEQDTVANTVDLIYFLYNLNGWFGTYEYLKVGLQWDGINYQSHGLFWHEHKYHVISWNVSECWWIVCTIESELTPAHLES